MWGLIFIICFVLAALGFFALWAIAAVCYRLQHGHWL